ncbi:exodeoxyribonuclease VII large subunit [Zymomonas mobilis]|uniref:Exodeoxyribonuclease 7 large subunit n=1 Tax=Zymomonas mobilis TaxID=542 RepID=A0A542VZP7_ZYMMB|nr:exodeoxyribonuclease VII large subunit [Zymomonas mobilis]
MNSFSFDGSDLLADSSATDNVRAFSVSEISGALKRTVEDAFSHIRVRGEITGFTQAASGHCYLSLKDEKAVLNSVIWRGSVSRIKFRPENGMEVIATGRLTTYAGNSRYQLVIESLEIAGKGALMALLDQRRRALAEEGLFSPERKRALPFMPKIIGVVSSPSGAVIRDILHRLADRCPTHVILWPVPVQGDQAAAKVAAAVRGFSALKAGDSIPRPDLLIVARGGGSLEDLWPFNEEILVRAVADSSIPVISAVGHETDTTLCDYAADLRAPTPTAAAELAVPVRSELATGLNTLHLRMNNAVSRYYKLSEERFEAVRRRLPDGERLMAPFVQLFDDRSLQLDRHISDRMANARHKLDSYAATLRPSLLAARIAREQARLSACRLPSGQRFIAQEQQRVDLAFGRLKQAYQQRLSHTSLRFGFLAEKLQPILIKQKWQQKSDQLAACHLRADLVISRLNVWQKNLDQLWRVAEQAHPDKILAKGYARVEDKNGHVVGDAKTAKQLAELNLVFHDGKVVVQPKDQQPEQLSLLQ